MPTDWRAAAEVDYDDQLQRPEPTAEELCAAAGHPPHGVDPDGPGGLPVQRCYCGDAIYETEGDD